MYGQKGVVVFGAATWIVARRPCVVPKDDPVATRGGGKGDMLLGAFWRRFHEADLGLQQ